MRFALFLFIFLSLSSPGSSKTVYVPDDYKGIQWAINFCQNGDTIIVRPGTYMEHIDFLGKDITLKSEKGAKCTVIDASKSYLKSTVSFRNGEGTGSIIEGFTLTNGTGNGGFSTGYGGGVYCKDSSPRILNNIIRNNKAVNAEGGGIYCENATPMISKNIIQSNIGIGGGIRCYDASPKIIGNTIINNTGFVGGGGIYCFGDKSSPEIVNNIIESNKAIGAG